jgi:hypothetical protein
MTAMVLIDPAIHGTSFPATYVPPGYLQAFGVPATQGGTTGTLGSNGLVSTYGGDTFTIVAASCWQDNDNVLTGNFSATGAVVVIPVGFAPKKISVWNDTDGILWTWMAGMAATHTMKLNSTGPAFTNDTGSAIVVFPDAAGGSGDVDYVQLSATLAANAKALCFRIEG